MLIKVPLIKNQIDTRVIAVSILSVLIAFVAQLLFDDTESYQNMTLETLFVLGTLIFPLGYAIYYYEPKRLYMSLILMSAFASFVIYNILVRIIS